MAEARRLPLVVIVGPTAVGKTGLAVRLAQDFDGVIISADSRQVYRERDMGTAKPTPEEQAAMAKWRVRNRAGGIRGYGGQEWSTTFPKELQEKEPGLQAMINGKRAPRGAEGQICISYPRAVEIATERFIHVFGNNPDLDYYTFSPNDNDAWC
ncbi:MAG TPA: isopentenyl transferase family protein, partial [Aggregatilineales bacterium]|nr:isopentenyl transferase family protein [Aggregatilineales bacterium]